MCDANISVLHKLISALKKQNFKVQVPNQHGGLKPGGNIIPHLLRSKKAIAFCCDTEEGEKIRVKGENGGGWLSKNILLVRGAFSDKWLSFWICLQVKTGPFLHVTVPGLWGAHALGHHTWPNHSLGLLILHRSTWQGNEPLREGGGSHLTTMIGHHGKAQRAMEDCALWDQR